MVGNRFYLLDDEFLPWKLDDEPPFSWPECRYFGDVLQAVDKACPDLGLHFVVTKRVHGKLPLQGGNVVVVCIGDELCCMPAYAHDVRLTAKTYGVQRTPNVLKGTSRPLLALAATVVQEAIVQGRRAPSLFLSLLRTLRRGRRPRVIDLPLGTYMLADVPFVPFDERPLDVSYAGSRVNRLRDAHRRVPTQKMRSRRELEIAIRDLATTRPELHLGIHIIDTFQDATDHSDRYSRLLMDSRISLCPRGGSLETYRFFEALRCGSIPVTERLPHRDYYTGAPGARVRNWTELPVVIDRLLRDPDGLKATHEAVLRWWAERCSPVAVAERLIAALHA